MHRYTHRLRATLFALSGCIFFFFAGHLFLPHLGIEDDEALFAEALYHPRAELFSIHIGRSHIPIMLMSYLGTLKTWIYGPIFRVVGISIRSLREPMLLAGAISIWLFYCLMRRIAGERAALIGCGLLAVDSMYLLTVCFDWGPVALQHLLTIGGMLLLVRFYQERQERHLFWGATLLGLALWDKALAIWIFSGIGIATILTLPRQIVDIWSRRRFTVAALGFALGALPLLVFNAANHFETFRGNFRRDTSNLSGKARILMDTARGPGLFGWMIDEDWQTKQPHQPSGAIETASAKISALAGQPRQHLLFYAFLLALLLAPLARGNDLRAIVFGLIVLAVAWIQMAIGAATGGSVHHTILLWPLPQWIVGISFAAASRRLGRAGIPALAVVMAVCLISGALVINEYLRVMIRNGGGQSWTDATYPLADYVKAQPKRNIVCMDWGMMDALRLLSRGKLQLRMRPDEVLKPEMTAGDRAAVKGMIAEPAHLYIEHTKEYEYFPGATPKLVAFAAEVGYDRQDLAVIPDSYGRPVYRIFQFVPR